VFAFGAKGRGGLEAVPPENLEPADDEPGRAYHHVERFES